MKKLLEEMLEEIRADGWMVAVHNDYFHHGLGIHMTFWLFTHHAGLWAKGEAATDKEAVSIAATQMKQRFKTP